MVNEYISSIYEKNRQSSKQCSLCVYYVSNYKDENNILRSACRFANSYGHVSHNPAATCSDYKEDKQFTLQEFIEQDVCFMVSDELISDDFDDIWEWIYNDTDYLQDLSEKEILDKYSHVKLYKKEFAKCPADIVDDYLKDNFYIESAALQSIPELVEVRIWIQNFNETQNWYIKGACVGWIDLSEIIKEYMKDEV
jgi:hypothetical protein